MKYLFVDESGDHNLQPSKMDPQFPLFILTGIFFDSKAYRNFRAKLLKFKKNFFGTNKIILHSKELTRPSVTKQKRLAGLTNVSKRKKFYGLLNNLLSDSDFKIFSFFVNKPSFVKSFGSISPDLYFLSFTNLLAEFEKILKKKEKGKIYTEARNKKLDKQFILAWESAKIANQYKSEKPSILSKSWKHAGLELADLISYRLARHLTKKAVKPIGNEVELSILKSKDLKIKSFGGKNKESRIRSTP